MHNKKKASEPPYLPHVLREGLMTLIDYTPTPNSCLKCKHGAYATDQIGDSVLQCHLLAPALVFVVCESGLCKHYTLKEKESIT